MTILREEVMGTERYFSCNVWPYATYKMHTVLYSYIWANVCWITMWMHEFLNRENTSWRVSIKEKSSFYKRQDCSEEHIQCLKDVFFCPHLYFLSIQTIPSKSTLIFRADFLFLNVWVCFSNFYSAWQHQHYLIGFWWVQWEYVNYSILDFFSTASQMST